MIFLDVSNPLCLIAKVMILKSCTHKISPSFTPWCPAGTMMSSLSWVQYFAMCWSPPHFLDQGSYLIYLTIIFLIIIWTMSLLKFLALSLNELYEMKRYEKDGVERNFILATLHWKEHLCKENLLESNTQMYILRMVFRKQVYCIILHLSVKPLCFGYIEKCCQMCFW